MRFSLIAFFTSLATSAVAGDFALNWPVDCELNETCHIQQYQDHDAGPGAQDFTCGSLSYDGHKGTDIALPHVSDMLKGVPVLAAADGKVVGIRNEMEDDTSGSPARSSYEGRECGNGVLIRHAGGWETQYCHLRQGSVLVVPDQKVTAGTPLGQIGMSGQTQFPHLHLSVRKHGTPVDPFDVSRSGTCGSETARDTIWATDVPYTAGGLLSIGFNTAVPSYRSIREGTANVPTLTETAQALVVWAYLYGGREGDIVDLTLTGPEGDVFVHAFTLEKDQARLFRATGRRLTRPSWPQGSYTGTADLRRDGQVIDRMQATLTVD